MTIKQIWKKIGLWVFDVHPEVIVNEVPRLETNLLAGKVALVTGGSRGIGKAIAERFLAAGATVVITGTNADTLSAAAEELASDRLFSMQWDVSHFDEYEARWQALIARHGHIDILVNNAAIRVFNGKRFDFLEVEEAEWEKVMAVNQKAVYFMCQHAAKHMIANHLHGHIVNIVSVNALRPALDPYGVSKWGCRGLTMGLGCELAPYGIVVNGIAPGSTATNMQFVTDGDVRYIDSIPTRHNAIPAEIGNLAVFLASDLGNNLVGEIVISDGGEHLH